MTKITFFSDGIIDLSIPNGAGIRHTLFDTVSGLVSYMDNNGIVEDEIITEAE